MQVDTTRFGRIDVPEDAVIHFPRGLYGLNGTRHFCLLQHDENGCFFWLQATDHPEVAMVVTDPFQFFPGYSVDIPDQAVELLAAESPADVAVYASVTVAPDRGGVSANLLGPLLVNIRTRCGLQLVQDGERYTARHPLLAKLETKAAA